MSGTADVSPRTLLTDPDAFFARRAPAYSMFVSGGIIGVVGILSFLMTVLVTARVASNIPASVRAFTYLGSFVGGIGAFVGTFVTWFVTGGAIYGFARLLGGDGDFRQLLKFVGFGYVVSVFGTVVLLAFTHAILSDVALPTTVEGVGSFRTAIRSHPYFPVMVLVGTLVKVWRGFLWVIAVKHAQRLTTARAAMAVAVPVLISIGWNVQKLL